MADRPSETSKRGSEDETCAETLQQLSKEKDCAKSLQNLLERDEEEQRREYIILATGNRSLTMREHNKIIEEEFKRMVRYLDLSTTDSVTLVVGSDKGADQLISLLVRLVYPHWNIKRYRADWSRHGRSAGFLMNQEMVEKEKPNILLAFPRASSPGTRHAILCFDKKVSDGLYRKVTEIY